MLSPWQPRLVLLAARIRPGESVLDVGAGTCALRDLLPMCPYTPLDRFPIPGGILANLDLHSQADWSLLQSGRWDVAVCAGVLEHLGNPLRVLSELRQWNADRILFSYATVESQPDESARKRAGWRSYLPRESFAALFGPLGWTVERFGEWNDAELFEARPQ